jgi:glutamate synthase (NADPH/NADH) large chain
LSSRTIVYKGMLTTPQLSEFFPDLLDPRVESALLLVHSRFSTNTFPSWPLAHPYRFVAHNGEINTVQGNQNWMRAREAMLQSDAAARHRAGVPDLHAGGVGHGPVRRGARAAAPRRLSDPSRRADDDPEAWENHETMSQEQRDFYRFHASMMEPWDGPASVAFTDGEVIGAVLDRNGLRPSRYWVTDDDLVVMASEVGVIDVDPSKVVAKGRLQPGKMFLIDTTQGRIVERRRDQVRAGRAAPVRRVARAGHGRPRRSARTRARRVQPRQRAAPPADVRLHPRGAEDPDHADGGERREALGSMGTDTPLAVLSERGRGCCSTTSPSCSRR